VIAAGTDGATTAVLGSIAAFIGGVGSGNNSFSNHTIAIRQSIIAVKRRIVAPPYAGGVVPQHTGGQNRSRRRQKWSDDLA